MKLYKELLIEILDREGVDVLFPKINLENVLKDTCYKALNEIKLIIQNDNLTDEDCLSEIREAFKKVEDIVVVLEGLGSGGGSRHDF